MNITWGMVGNSHDASLAVFDDKELLWASLAKDFSKVPNDPDFSQMQIDVAIQSFGLPSAVQWYERPGLKTLRQWRAGQGWLWKENNIRSYLERWSINVPITYTQHHLSHAAYAYYTQPHDDCAVVCLDSIGEFETLTVWHGKNNKLKKLYSQGYPHSLGLFYSAMTQRIGLIPNRDEYLVTEWAAKGNGIYLMHDMLQELVKVNQDSNKPSVRMRENLHRGCRWWKPELTSKQDMYDIAAATQAVFEYCVKLLSNYAHYKTNHGSAIAFAGGGALNKKAMDQVRKDWDSVWVPPNPGDPGSCIGAVLAQTKTKITLDKQWYKAI
jgi:carbamoyltransferase|tara:strand:- start:1130 stop:2104 length:975 start_codon:yes stop_codon:yes gene_type:complete